jgi:exodeoxyribonuclease V beta subunit
VALHRYLKTRVSNYQPEQQLGGAVYLFLRGMRRDQAEQGIWHWCPPVAWIERLDAALNGEPS